uniref:Ras-GEF domain-containing protein n=1 Tax=Arcella intermedia TaxID=1963864 RepID=A0A6B2KX96_9EUKA
MDIARQITDIDYMLFSKVQPWELINQTWTKPKNAPNVASLTKWFNDLTNLTKSLLLCEFNFKTQIRILVKLLEVFLHLWTLKNYSSTMALNLALNSIVVSKLKTLWDSLKSYGKLKSNYDKISKLCSPEGNFKKLRKFMETVEKPIVPYIGMYFQELIYAEERNPKFTERGLFNCHRIRNLGHIIQTVRTIQDYLVFQRSYEANWQSKSNSIKEFLFYTPRYNDDVYFANLKLFDPKNKDVQMEKPRALLSSDEKSQGKPKILLLGWGNSGKTSIVRIFRPLLIMDTAKISTLRENTINYLELFLGKVQEDKTLEIDDRDLELPEETEKSEESCKSELSDVEENDLPVHDKPEVKSSFLSIPRFDLKGTDSPKKTGMKSSESKNDLSKNDLSGSTPNKTRAAKSPSESLESIKSPPEIRTPTEYKSKTDTRHYPESPEDNLLTPPVSLPKKKTITLFGRSETEEFENAGMSTTNPTLNTEVAGDALRTEKSAPEGLERTEDDNISAAKRVKSNNSRRNLKRKSQKYGNRLVEGEVTDFNGTIQDLSKSLADSKKNEELLKVVEAYESQVSQKTKEFEDELKKLETQFLNDMSLIKTKTILNLDNIPDCDEKREFIRRLENPKERSLSKSRSISAVYSTKVLSPGSEEPKSSRTMSHTRRMASGKKKGDNKKLTSASLSKSLSLSTSEEPHVEYDLSPPVQRKSSSKSPSAPRHRRSSHGDIKSHAITSPVAMVARRSEEYDSYDEIEIGLSEDDAEKTEASVEDPKVLAERRRVLKEQNDKLIELILNELKNDPTQITPSVAKNFTSLWKQRFFKKAYTKHCLTIPSEAKYHFDKILNYASETYDITQEDMLHAYLPTSGILTHEVKLLPPSRTAFTLIDTGGRHSEQRKWEKYWSDASVDVIVFVVALDEAFMGDTNREIGTLEAVLKLWGEVTGNPKLGAVPFVLALNRKDVFEKYFKLAEYRARIPVERGKDYESCLGAIVHDFRMAFGGCWMMEVITNALNGNEINDAFSLILKTL